MSFVPWYILISPKNGVMKNNYWPHYGIDLIIFKISKKNAINFQTFQKIINNMIGE